MTRRSWLSRTYSQADDLRAVGFSKEDLANMAEVDARTGQLASSERTAQAVIGHARKLGTTPMDVKRWLEDEGESVREEMKS